MQDIVIQSIVQMLKGMDESKLRKVYQFVLHLAK